MPEIYVDFLVNICVFMIINLFFGGTHKYGVNSIEELILISVFQCMVFIILDNTIKITILTYFCVEFLTWVLFPVIYFFYVVFCLPWKDK